MLERDGYPPGVPCWIDTAQPDPEAAARFYGGLFGWEFEDRMPGRYLVARIEGRDVAAIGSQAGDAPPVWTTYVAVESADAAAAKVRDGGGTVLIEPSDVGDAGRMAAFADPAGAEFCVWQAGSRKGAQLVNHPGTWNWSDLNTRDLEGAKAFYGGLFGWEDSPVDFGMGEYTMWRVLGYAEVLERSDPDLRRRQAEAGAPSGFADAVAWLLPLGDDAAPRWAVTFAVDDADAVAARAAELGGTIDVSPFDAGPTRVAILSDPQGASFSVSRYDPGS